MINSVVLVGRLTKEVEIRYTKNEKAVGNFTLAVNRRYKNQNGETDTDFIDCTLFGAIAETLSKYSTKGDLLGVNGSLQKRCYEDKEGNKKYLTEVMVEKITFLQAKKETPRTVKSDKEENPYKDMSIKTEQQQQFEIKSEDLPW